MKSPGGGPALLFQHPTLVAGGASRFPVAVNPETRLAALARKRGWLVEHWSRAPGGPRPLLPIGPVLRSATRPRPAQGRAVRSRGWS